MKKLNVLLVEDNEGDILLTREAFEESTMEIDLNVVKNGKDAIDFLHQTASFSKAVKPDLILLDLNIPIYNGLEVLDEIKKDPKLKKIPVIILTTSSNPTDISKAYDLHANSFVTKPIDMTAFLQTVESIQEFWLQTCVLSAS